MTVDKRQDQLPSAARCSSPTEPLWSKSGLTPPEAGPNSDANCVGRVRHPAMNMQPDDKAARGRENQLPTVSGIGTAHVGYARSQVERGKATRPKRPTKRTA